MATVGDQVPPGNDAVWIRIRALEDRLAQIQSQAANASAIASSIQQIKVQPDVGNAVASGFTLTTTSTVLSTFNFTVPVGYTRAVIYAVASIASSTNSTGGDILWGRVTIGASGGSEAPQQGPASNPFGNIAAAHSVSLTGLIAGQTIAVSSAARWVTGTGNNLRSYAIVNGQALYLT